jgi:hypothetical protein
MNQRSKRDKNGRNKLLRNKNAQKNKQLEKKKETSILAEMGSGPDNGKILQEKRKILKIYSDKCQRNSTADRDTEAENTSQSPSPPPFWGGRKT